MAIVARSFKLKITPGGVPPTVHVSEYDVGRQFTVTLLDEDGQAFAIPTGTTAKIEGTIAGHGFSESATSCSGSTVVFQLTANMTAYAGRCWTKIKLTKSGEPVSTCGFVLDVDRAGLEAGTVINNEGFDELILEAVTEYLDENNIVIDDTLAVAGAAADAKATGDRLTALEEASIETDETLTVSGAAADAATVGSALADCGFGDSEVYEYQTNAGYIKTDGTTGSASQTRLEVTSARIAVQPGEKLRFTIAFPSAQQLWLAYGKYSSNGTFTERVVLVANVDYANYSTIITVPEGTYGIVLSYTTYDTASASLEFLSETPVERIRALEARGSLTDTQLDAFLALFDHVMFKDDPNDAIYGLLSAFNATGTIDTTAKIEMTDSFACGRDSYESWSNAAITITYGTANGELRYNNRFAGILPHALSGIPKSSNNPSMQFLTNGRVTTYYNEINSDLERWMQPAGSSPTEFEANGQISGGYNGVRFSVDVRYLNVSYIYDAETGNVLFAGRNTPYFGMKNINGTMRTRGDTDVF